eukprot:2918246-Alexandrium_andersonii.AAC.1
MLQFTHCGLRIEADCRTDEHWAVCGLHFGHPEMQRSRNMHTCLRRSELELRGPRNDLNVHLR